MIFKCVNTVNSTLRLLEIFFFYYYFCFAYCKCKKKGNIALHHTEPKYLYLEPKLLTIITHFLKGVTRDWEVGEHNCLKENDLVFLET